VLHHVSVVQVRYMDFVIIGEDALLEDSNINVNNSAVVFKNNRVRAVVFRQFILLLLMVCAMMCGSKEQNCVSVPARLKIV
jgi:hypothetical protein